MKVRRVRTSQPQNRVEIDWSNPITRGLVWWETPDNGKMIPSTITGAKRYPGVRGMGYGFGSGFGTTTTDIVKTQFKQHSTLRSYFGISMATDGASNLGRVFDKRTGATDSENLLVETSEGNKLIRYGRQWTGLAQWSSPINSIVTGREFTWGVNYDSSASSNAPELYVDGTSRTVTVTAAASGSLTNNTDFYTLGNRDSDKARGTIGYTTLWLVFDRILSAAEHLSLHSNPWQIFKPRLLPVGGVTVTAQYARPTSDVSAGTWTASSGSDLFAMLDESPANDADYISTVNASICEVALGALTDPASSTGHVVRYRIAADSGGIIVRLRQGSTTIATWTHNPAPSSLTTYAQTLTGGEADAITNYAALKLQFEATP